MLIKQIGETKLLIDGGKLCIKIFDTKFWVTDSDLEELGKIVEENSQPIQKVEVFANNEKLLIRVEREGIVQSTKVLSPHDYNEINRAIENIARNEKELELITNEVNSKLR